MTVVSAVVVHRRTEVESRRWSESGSGLFRKVQADVRFRSQKRSDLSPRLPKSENTGVCCPVRQKERSALLCMQPREVWACLVEAIHT